MTTSAGARALRTLQKQIIEACAAVFGAGLAGLEMAGGFTVYESARLPKDCQQEEPGYAARRATIVKLLGFQ